MEKASPENNYHYNPRLKDYANSLRKNMSKPEACLWKYVLSRRQTKGYQFRRQRPVLTYIADFMCPELLLIVEVDGIQHDSEEAYQKDQTRDGDLEAVGFSVLRFSAWEVLNRIVDVSIIIGDWIETNAVAPPPGPRQRKRRSRGDSNEEEGEE